MTGVPFADALAREAARMPWLRARTPEETLAAVAPALPACGISRVAPVTHLDNLGIPVWVSVRPGGQVLQVSNGKGLTDAAARVSAAMEACELHLAENPAPARLRRGSMARLAQAEPGARVVAPAELVDEPAPHFTPDFIAEWTSGVDMGAGGRVWIPSSVVYFNRRPMLTGTNTNGLASGNTHAEAQLHALYEVIERDAMCALRAAGGRLRLRGRARVVEPGGVSHPPSRLIVERCAARGTRVVLMALPAPVAVTAIWAVFLNPESISARTAINVGYGAHVNPGVALTRALTEAAQSRLTKIHGARDDIRGRTGRGRDTRAWRALAGLVPDTDWAEIESAPRLDLPEAPEEAVPALVAELVRRGKGPVYGFDLGGPGMDFFCARIVAPGLAFRKSLF